MITIHELLSRIRWDPEFGRGDFTIGYYDRLERRIITVPLRELSIDPADHFAFDVLDQNLESHRVPYHRVRRVFKNGKLIWHRRDDPQSGASNGGGEARERFGQEGNACGRPPHAHTERSDLKRRPKRTSLSAGAVVLRRYGDAWRCLMLRAYRNWDFPKGAVEAGESLLAAARRELREETSLADVDMRWGEQYCETAPYRGGKIARYYLAVSPQGEVTLPPNPELGHPEHHEYRWVGFAEARKLAPPRLHPIIDWAEGLSAGVDRSLHGTS